MMATAAGIPHYAASMSELIFVPGPLGGTHDQRLNPLTDSLRGQVIEGFRIYEAEAHPNFYAPDDDESIWVSVLMDDPVDDAPGWPFEELEAFDEAIRERSSSLGIPGETSIRHIALRRAAEVRVPAETIARARAASDAAGR
jgi:hypothetical protein